MKKLRVKVCTALLVATASIAGPAHPADATPVTDLTRAAGPTDSRKWSPPLRYHGGPVIVTAKNYLVFWTGGDRKAFDAKYVSLLQRWHKDARHMTVFKVATQYGQADGQHPTDTAYAGTFVDNTPFPGKGACAQVCVGEADIARIARTTAAAHRVKPGLSNIIYVYTPAGVHRCNELVDGNTGCYDDDEGPHHNGRCGYHDHATAGKGRLVFAYVPHPGRNCHLTDGRQRFPNDVAADAAISLTSAFQMEAITNPLHNAWYDDNDEGPAGIAAECEWLFGPLLPGRKGNSHYAGHTYDLQAEASNQEEGCVVGSAVDGF